MTKEAAGSFVSGYEAYWRRTAGEIERAIKGSVIILDTNAIVNLYRMASGGREEYFAVLEKVSDRLWVPRQVVDEFHKVRLSAVASHITGLKAKSGAVSEAAEAFKVALKDFARLYSLANGRVSEYMEPLDTAISGILEHVHSDVEGFDLDPSDLASSDPILDRLAEMLDGKVGSGIAEGDLKAALAEAKLRGEQKIPPGYKDWEKKGEDGAGDYLIWQEMLEFAKSVHQDILFVSTDVKEDWFRRQAGFVIGPRPELVKEMQDEAGSSYHHVTLAEFLRTASEALGVFVSPNTINRAQELERDRNQFKLNLTRQVLAASESLQDAIEEREKYAQELALVSDRSRLLQGTVHRLGERLNEATLGELARASMSREADVLSRELRELNDRLDVLVVTVERCDNRIEAARADLNVQRGRLDEAEALF
ncbi:PIN-like domain-containing protein [Streptomyces sp. NBC_00401]|uniref:PIN-like domain-containing protein n=1 Tax=Streptomyces sp. NBC_00401 TaxID=2975738 RepID=UPI002255387B|nr:PIN-like domain-containing protein [Streptomyces sp. NBC_00401]MCX5083420.1 PIN-like domain-containing protein [Streptomyces sp. NBC_00401]